MHAARTRSGRKGRLQSADLFILAAIGLLVCIAGRRSSRRNRPGALGGRQFALLNELFVFLWIVVVVGVSIASTNSARSRTM